MSALEEAIEYLGIDGGKVGAIAYTAKQARAELALYREAYRLLLLCRNEYPGTLYVTYEKDGRNVRDMTDELKQKMEGLTK